MNRAETVKLGERIAEQAAHLDAATHRLLADLREFDREGGHLHQGARSCAQWLSWRIGCEPGTARERVRVARKLGELPLVDDCLRRGELSYCKVRAITRVATQANEATLVETARLCTGAQLALLCRKYAAVARQSAEVSPTDDRERRYVRRRELDDGMVKIEAVLHPEEAALVWAAIERRATEPCRESSSEASDAGAGFEPVANVSAELSSAGVGSRLAENASAEASNVENTVTGASKGCATARPVEHGSAEPCNRSSVAGTRASVPAETSEERSLAVSAEPSSDRLVERPRERASVAVSKRVFDRADALVAIAAEVVRGSAPHRSPIELAVMVTADALRHPTRFDAMASSNERPPGIEACGLDCAAAPAEGDAVVSTGGGASPVDHRVDGGVTELANVAVFGDGTCVSSDVVRRLACDCGVVEVVTDERGIALSVGRRRRTIPGALKRALLRRDRTCRFPGCTTRVFLEGHHLVHWIDGGETRLDQMAALCSHHHRYMHEYGYSMSITPRGELEIHDDRGQLVPEAFSHTLPRVGADVIEWQNTSLAISADTSVCGWDGCAVDYGACIEVLLAADELGSRASAEA